MNIGLIGCGKISNAYLKNAKRLGLHFIAAADLMLERAEATAKEFGIPKALTTEQLLADKDVQAVLNLTIPEAHYPVSLASLQAGKHVYSEKPLSVTREEGAALLALAKSKNLRIGCAPDTFLGSSLQIGRKLIDEGAIGTPTNVEVMFYGRGPEDPTHFLYRPGGGILMDMGPYYLTALVSLLGPVTRLAASTKTIPTEKMLANNEAAAKKVPVATTVTGVLDMARGITAALNISYNVCEYYYCHLRFHGTKGTIIIPDPNNFGGDVTLKSFGEEKEKIITTGQFAENSRGVGLADMLRGISENRPHRASAEMCMHVLDIMYSIYESSQSGTFVQLSTTMQRPEPFKEALPV